MKPDPNDAQYKDQRITQVRLCDNAAEFEVQLDEGLWLFAGNPSKLPHPQVGEVARLYGKGFGFPVRGFVVGERVYYYRTAEEEERAHQKQVQEWQEERRQSFKKNHLAWERDLATLPEPFRKRIERFMSRNPEWASQYGPYEMFTCKEAVKIANRLPLDKLQEFHKADHDAQKRMVPELEYEEHSGNTFGAAVKLAFIFLKDASLVPQAHGALCPLVGCQDYGCYAAELADVSDG